MARILSYQLRSNFLSCPLIITLQNVLHLVILHKIEQCILQIKDDEWGIKSGFIQITNAKYFFATEAFFVDIYAWYSFPLAPHS